MGDLALHAIQDSNMEFEIGFTIARENQGKGFAAEAATRLINYLFSEIGATKIIAQPDSRNTASKRLLRSLGFEMDESKGWLEQFKGEEVTVEHFLLTNQSEL